MENISDIQEKIREEIHTKNYVNDGTSEENLHISDKYVSTGESEFSREVTHPLDEVLSERHFSIGEETYFATNQLKGQQRSDEHIMQEVRDVLMRSTDLDPSDIDIEVHEGHVTLLGSVPSRLMKKKAESSVEEVFGVLDVHNRLIITAHGRPLVDNRTGLNQDPYSMKKLFVFLFILTSFSSIADTAVFNMDPELAGEVQSAINPDVAMVRQEEEERPFDKDLSYDDAVEVYDGENINGYDSADEDTEGNY